MKQPLVIIIAGSKSDQTHFQKIAQAVKSCGVQVIIRIGSAHKTAHHVLDMLADYEKIDCPKVYITVAGRSNALSGLVDGAVLAPVIACPPLSESNGHTDIFSSLHMPQGIAPALVLDPLNAAGLALRILALSNPDLSDRINQGRKLMKDIIIKDDAEFHVPA